MRKQLHGLKSLADFTEEERKVLLWTGGKKVCVTDADKVYMCYHHLSKLGRIFEKRFTRFTCCNLFKTQKRNVKGGHRISLQLATKLLDHRYACISGWQLCTTCYDIAQKIEKNVGNEMSQSGHESTQIYKLDSATELVNLTRCLQSERKLRIQFKIAWGTFIFCSLSTEILRSVLSKAFEKSSKNNLTAIFEASVVLRR